MRNFLVIVAFLPDHEVKLHFLIGDPANQPVLGVKIDMLYLPGEVVSQWDLVIYDARDVQICYLMQCFVFQSDDS